MKVGNYVVSKSLKMLVPPVSLIDFRVREIKFLMFGEIEH